MNKTTYIVYKGQIERFFKYLYNSAIIDEYISSCLSDTSAYQFTYAIKKLLEDFDLKVDFNIDQLKKNAEKNKFTRDEAEKFLYVVKNSKKATAERDYWIFRIIIETGLLPRELVGGFGLPGIENFKYHEINNDKFVEVVRKGGYCEYLRISDDVYYKLKKGITNRTQYYPGAEVKPMTYSNLWYLFKEYYQEAIALGILQDRKYFGVTLLTYCDIDRYGMKPGDKELVNLTL